MGDVQASEGSFARVQLCVESLQLPTSLCIIQSTSNTAIGRSHPNKAGTRGKLVFSSFLDKSGVLRPQADSLTQEARTS